MHGGEDDLIEFLDEKRIRVHVYGKKQAVGNGVISVCYMSPSRQAIKSGGHADLRAKGYSRERVLVQRRQGNVVLALQ